ncbi:MAG: glutamate-5-semialdehyde dehydrogenase [Acidimicrobiia bacterium]|nr:glutamate-5-semialdehyde dehydrogenase [Acidimicrobiia bacterium]
MIDELGRRAGVASRILRTATAATKNAALELAADEVEKATDVILDANQEDMERARNEGVTGALLDRQLLNPERVSAMADGLRVVASLPDPVGSTTAGWVLPNGLKVERVRAPLGVVAVIYEARPNVTSDAGGLCLKAGNAALLRGSSFTLTSNMAIAAVMREALDKAGLPEDAIQVVEDTSREGAKELMTTRKYVDLLVPRGGPSLIAAMEAEATVPFVIDGAGNCHVYVDASADLARAEAIVLNSKTHRPGVCNAAETLLVHQAVADEFLPKVAGSLMAAGVELRGDETARNLVDGIDPATDDDWAKEYLDMVMAVRVVPSLEDAVAHVNRYGTGHTEAIVTDRIEAADQFVNGTDSGVVMVNASTRFTDGGEFGFGAEIGNSTQKLHVRGPMGLEALTSERYIVTGDGQVRQ